MCSTSSSRGTERRYSGESSLDTVCRKRQVSQPGWSLKEKGTGRVFWTPTLMEFSTSHLFVFKISVHDNRLHTMSSIQNHYRSQSLITSHSAGKMPISEIADWRWNGCLSQPLEIALWIRCLPEYFSRCSEKGGSERDLVTVAVRTLPGWTALCPKFWKRVDRRMAILSPRFCWRQPTEISHMLKRVTPVSQWVQWSISKQLDSEQGHRRVV
jgi:hypothetical protein